ncbi:MAG: bis(5'-nucleosyl)-tetraphosphatase (symmetrical) YqeK [Eubacteriales bacterium]
MIYEEIQDKVRLMLSPKRFEHALGVKYWAEILAHKYGCDIEKARIAAISHDCAREYPIEELIQIAENRDPELDEVTMMEPQLLHGSVGSIIAKNKLGINDDEILSAIRYHTTGKTQMTLLDKIIYISDVIEESRCYDGVERVRQLVMEDLDSALILSLDNTIRYVLSIHGLLHPRTIEARNDLLLKNKEKRGGLL